MKQIEDLAAEKHATAAQIALAWVLAQGDDVVPIPGTKRRKYLEQNIAAADVTLSAGELEKLSTIFAPGATQGTRYPQAAMAALNR